jgi:hypothetical protein
MLPFSLLRPKARNVPIRQVDRPSRPYRTPHLEPVQPSHFQHSSVHRIHSRRVHQLSTCKVHRLTKSAANQASMEHQNDGWSHDDVLVAKRTDFPSLPLIVPVLISNLTAGPIKPLTILRLALHPQSSSKSSNFPSMLPTKLGSLLPQARYAPITKSAA